MFTTVILVMLLLNVKYVRLLSTIYVTSHICTLLMLLMLVEMRELRNEQYVKLLCSIYVTLHICTFRLRNHAILQREPPSDKGCQPIPDLALPPQVGDASWTSVHQKTRGKHFKCYSSKSPQGISPKLHEKVLEPKNHSS